MKRTALIAGVLVALAAPSVVSAGNPTAQAKLQVSAQVTKIQVVRTQIVRTQIARAQVVRANVVRGQVAKLQVVSRHAVRPMGTKIVPLRTPR